VPSAGEGSVVFCNSGSGQPKSRAQSRGLIAMADPERLELPTSAFEAHCSIQLSYGSAGLLQSIPSAFSSRPDTWFSVPRDHALRTLLSGVLPLPSPQVFVTIVLSSLHRPRVLYQTSNRSSCKSSTRAQVLDKALRPLPHRVASDRQGPGAGWISPHSRPVL
jgi:hypothetical protein